jgi:hypothetical protein
MTAPEPRRLEPMPPAVADLAADVLTLLRKGRVTVAVAQLEKLPELVRDEITEGLGAASWAGYQRGYRVGYEQGQRALAQQIQGTARRPAARSAKYGHRSHATVRNVQARHAWLRECVRDPRLRRRALDVLGIREADLDVVLEGRAQLSSTMWKRLREELGG